VIFILYVYFRFVKFPPMPHFPFTAFFVFLVKCPCFLKKVIPAKSMPAEAGACPHENEVIFL